MSGFQKEERYIVIKRKYLSDEDEGAIRGLLEQRGIETRECVVIESKLKPEYKKAWQLIEARYNKGID